MALTKVAGDILDPGIVVAGIVTATAFDGPFRGGSGSDIIAGVVTCTELDLNGNGDISGNLVIGGNLTAGGDFTTLNTTLRNVELLRVYANSATTAGIITQTGAGDILNLFDGTTEVMTVVDGGNVGIGITNPTRPLTIKAADPRIRLIDSDTNSFSEVYTDNTGHLYLNADAGQSNGGSRILFNVDGSEKVRIDADGRLLQSITAVGDYMHQMEGAGGTGKVPAILFKNGTASTNEIIGGWTAYNTTNQVATIYAKEESANDDAYLQFSTRATGGSLAERLRITSDGRVSIGNNPTVDSNTNLHIEEASGECGVVIEGNTGGAGAYLLLRNNSTSSNPKRYIGGVDAGGQGTSQIEFHNLDNGTNEGQMVLSTRPASGSMTPRVYIDSSGRVLIGTTTEGYAAYADQLTLANSGTHCGMTIRSATGGVGSIYFSDGTSSNNEYRGYVEYHHTTSGVSDYFKIGTAAAHKLTIDTTGHITPGSADTQDLGSTSKEFRNLYLGNSGKAFFGSTQTLSIYNDGTNSLITDSSSAMFVRSNRVLFQNSAGNKGYGEFTNGGSVYFTYDNVKRIETSGIGVTVTGEVAASQDYPNYRPTLDFNFAAVKKLDPRFTYYRTGPASYTDEFGIVKLVGDNTPRFDHDPTTGECKGLLIEEQRTNIFASSDPANSNWAMNNATKTANTTDTKDPAGTYTSTKLMSAASANSGGQIYDHLNQNSGGVQSCWAKKGTHNVLGIWDSSSGSAGIRGWFDLNTGEHRCEGGSKVAAGVQSSGNDSNTTNMVEYPNGWYRCIYYEAANMIWCHFRICDFDADLEASSSSNSIYLWGLQGEIGGVTFASSHIPCNTGAVPGTATRGLDYVSIEGDEHSDFWSTTEGTYLIDYEPLERVIGDGVIIGSRRGSNGSGYPWPLYRHDTANTNIFKSYDLTTGIVSISSAYEDRRESWALGFNGTNGSIVRNGSQLITNNTSMKGLIDADELWLGNNGLGSNQYAMHVRRFMYYPKRISDSQLITLTS